MYETFTHLARDTSRDLVEAHLMEVRRLRDAAWPSTDWRGLAQSVRARQSPLGPNEMTLLERDVRHGQYGPELTNPGLAIAVHRRTLHLSFRGKSAGTAEALRYADEEGRDGWFFYGWSRLP